MSFNVTRHFNEQWESGQDKVRFGQVTRDFRRIFEGYVEKTPNVRFTRLYEKLLRYPVGKSGKRLVHSFALTIGRNRYQVIAASGANGWFVSIEEVK